MAQKSKAAALTSELLAPKGAAAPAEQSPQPAADPVEPESNGMANAVSNGGRVEFPLHLDPADHFELRMASARSGRSCEELIAEALSRYLAEIAEESEDSEQPHSGKAE